jgi:hypothetical protein
MGRASSTRLTTLVFAVLAVVLVLLGLAGPAGPGPGPATPASTANTFVAGGPDVRPVAAYTRRAAKRTQWRVPARFGPTRGRPFSARSPFNTRIGRNVRVDRRSRAMVRVLAGRGYATAQVYGDTPPVYNAYARTPRYRMDCARDEWGTCDLERMRVPIPRGAKSSPGPDANMVVIDWSTGRTYEFWQYRNDRRTASWGAVLPLAGSGTGNNSSDPGRHGAVGAGVSRLAGVIRVHEIRKGHIPHALVGPTGFSCKSSLRYPAVKSDGWSTARNCIPEGARVQLRPRVNCARLPGIRPWEVTVCRALKTYGWYNIDNGNVGVAGFGIQFENPTGGRNPYPRLGLREYRPIRHIPLHQLRILRSWRSFG